MAVDLGRYGIWQLAGMLTPGLATEIERLGYGTIWIGGSPPADLALAESLLDATEHVVVATGIVNMWQAAAKETAESYHRIVARHPGRFLLGVGIGHPEGQKEYRSPFDTIQTYLDDLDAAGVPVEDRALAALGPKVMRVAGERTAGAAPYLTVPEHAREAREILGTGPLLAPEHKVVVSTDAAHARELGRSRVRRPYLELVNYRRNLLRTGFTETDIDTESDQLIDALVLHGDADTVAAGLDAHLAAGADHVCAQVFTAPGAPDEEYRAALRALAGGLGLG
ncbi:LLM class F420-dependent oxidoreductase [Pseudonocardia halophobica]|uniref:LLM class F420-dependent oxidoreductase n=1 Tax=Pseudonocardia halophobica TaxID=29401 RepID=A0A9W6KY74_9PSEU|nr:LLM class F420-dependent oxidoreductase [Pseudonocardia halophobica]GLL09863.1 LLM class F420-dependent oxidoreductase [Pseudonocardia halophobica]